MEDLFWIGFVGAAGFIEKTARFCAGTQPVVIRRFDPLSRAGFVLIGKVQAICDVADAVRQCLHLRLGQGREMVKVRDKAAPGPSFFQVGQARQGCAFAGLGMGQKLGNQLVDLGPDLFRHRRQRAVKHPQRAKGV